VQTAIWVALIFASIVGVALFVLSVIVFRSLRELGRAADHLAQGDFNHGINVKGPLPVRGLAGRLNEMAGQLQSRLATVVQQRNELGAVLSSMSEGVVAIDLEERIISLNRAAAQLLSLAPTWAIGRPIHEALRNSALQSFVGRTLTENAPLQQEITLRPSSGTGDEARYVQAVSAVLRDAAGRGFGVVVVLHEVTQLRRLELIRREFVANVSHEIKTPVSAIRAATETLQNGQEHDPEQVKRILGIVGRQSERLGQIVEDLLSLARIEQREQQMTQELGNEPLLPVLRAATETCQAKAEQKQISLSVDCSQALRAHIDRPLLEQAVVNLIDNAVKYSPSGTTVQIRGWAGEAESVIAVTDQGRGIEPEHLPRVFERFYRTDKARSRAVGGTGLGLSIVKHVAEVQGGRVSVDSNPGRGSEFRIHLARAVGDATAEAPAKPEPAGGQTGAVEEI
jgi:two-component system phosphate regulon sensor histidine kinase PhoR